MEEKDDQKRGLEAFNANLLAQVGGGWGYAVLFLQVQMFMGGYRYLWARVQKNGKTKIEELEGLSARSWECEFRYLLNLSELLFPHLGNEAVTSLCFLKIIY